MSWEDSHDDRRDYALRARSLAAALMRAHRLAADLNADRPNHTKAIDVSECLRQYHRAAARARQCFAEMQARMGDR